MTNASKEAISGAILLNQKAVDEMEEKVISTRLLSDRERKEWLRLLGIVRRGLDLLEGNLGIPRHDTIEMPAAKITPILCACEIDAEVDAIQEAHETAEDEASERCITLSNFQGVSVGRIQLKKGGES